MNRMPTLMIVIMLIAGLVFVYAAIKNQDPRNLIKDAITGKAK